jgi:hypothetical protein
MNHDRLQCLVTRVMPFGKFGLKGVAVELRVAARVRHATHVNESGHRVGRKQSNKFSERPRRMAHGQYNGL